MMTEDPSSIRAVCGVSHPLHDFTIWPYRRSLLPRKALPRKAACPGGQVLPDDKSSWALTGAFLGFTLQGFLPVAIGSSLRGALPS